MRLAVDGKRLVQARTGPARWLEHMLWQWSSNGTPFDEIICYTPGQTDAGWALPPTVRHENLATHLSPIIWENTQFRWAASKCDVVFGASYTLPLGLSTPSVVSIQGIYEGENAEPGPWWHKYRYSALYRQSARVADLVLANSISTKNDIVEFYDIDPDKIRIVYQGVGKPFGWREDRESLAEEAEEILGNRDPFFLFVGKLSPRRNVPILLTAFRESLSQMDTRARLILIGPNHVDMPLDEHIQENSLQDDVIHIPHLSQEKLASLYGSALAFILPTTHEGLSATMLEAMACGAPVLTVDHAPLHDGIYENVWALEAPDVELLRNAIVQLANESDIRDELCRKGLNCAARFSWGRAAKETAAACWEVVTR